MTPNISFLLPLSLASGHGRQPLISLWQERFVILQVEAGSLLIEGDQAPVNETQV